MLRKTIKTTLFLSGLIFFSPHLSQADEGKKYPILPKEPNIIGSGDPVFFPIRPSKLDLKAVWQQAQSINPAKDSMSPGRAPGAEANVSAPSSKLAFNYNDEVLNVVKVLTNDAHGSGFYIDPKKRNVDETYVVTNYHVIEGYREVGVQFHPRAYSSSTKK